MANLTKVAERPLSALDVIFTRRSVRAYAATPLDSETVRALLDAAVQAPSALHAEPWTFVVVQDRDALRRCSDRAKALWAEEITRHPEFGAAGEAMLRTHFAQEMANPDFNIFYDAGTLVVICAKAGPFVTADCWLAAGNLMLAACAMGLGSCCIGSAVAALNSPEIKQDLNIPADTIAVAPIVVGVPHEVPTPAVRKPPTILSWKVG